MNAVLGELGQLQAELQSRISALRKKHPSLDEAFSSYTSQYGENAVKPYEPFKISGTLDPVVIILGQTTPLIYKDSKRLLTGSLDTVKVENGETYVLGRRRSIDSKLLVWSSTQEVEIEEYNSRLRVIPSRIHAAIQALDDGEVFFVDLGSTSGSMISGENPQSPFVVLYSAGTAEVRNVALPPKYKDSTPR